MIILRQMIMALITPCMMTTTKITNDDAYDVDYIGGAHAAQQRRLTENRQEMSDARSDQQRTASTASGHRCLTVNPLSIIR